MAPLSRTALRKIIREKAGVKVANDGSDLLLGLDHVLFLRDLMYEAEKLADESGSSEILPTHLRKARINVLKSFRG